MSRLRCLRSFFIVASLSFIFPFTAFADETDYTWSVSGTLGGPGSTSELSIAVENTEAIDNFGLDICLPDIIEPSNLSSATANIVKLERARATILPSFPHGHTDTLRMSYLNMVNPQSDGTVLPGSGDVIKILVKVKDTASPGDTGTVVINIGAKTTLLTTYQVVVGEAAAAPVLGDLGVLKANLGDTLSFSLSLTDSTLTGLTYGMITSPGTGATLDSLTGAFSWLSDSAGAYPAVFTVTDASGLADTLTVDLIINSLPVFEALDTLAVNLGETVEFTLAATDADTGDSLVFRAGSDLPTTVVLDSVTGQVSWTPGSAGVVLLNFLVSDGFTEDSLSVVVNVNTPPALTAPVPQTGKTGAEITFSVAVIDDDGDALTYLLLSSPGAGAVLDSLTGIFTWIPAEVGAFTAWLGVTDGKAIDSVSVEFTLEQGIMQLIIVSPIGGASYSVPEGGTLLIPFLITNPADSLYLQALELPTGAELLGDTLLRYIPGQADAGQYPVSVMYSNETLGSDTVNFTITVTAVNVAPVWPVLSDTLTAKEGVEFSYTFDLPVDSDPGDMVVVSARNLPVGASFNAATRTVTWEPGFEEAGVYQFILVATDIDGARGTQLVTLTVENVNRAPMMLLAIDTFSGVEAVPLSFTVGAYDPDGDRITVVAVGLPDSALFVDPVFSWSDPVPGEYTVQFIASDKDSLADTADVSITIIGVNEAPVFDPVADIAVDAGVAVEIVLSATDPEDDELVYSLVLSGADDIISRGATFSANTFTWTPANSDIGPNIVTFMVADPDGLQDRIEATITVTGRNIKLPPEFDDVFYAVVQEVQEEEALEVVLQATLTDLELDSLTFWVSGLPEGALFDSLTNTLSWTPGLLQAGIYEVSCGVSDGSFKDNAILIIKVLDKDVDPVLDPVGSLEVDENSLLKVSLSATDASGESITFDATGLPEGAQVFTQGLVKFKPTFEQADGYQVTFYAFDASGNEASETVTLTVADVNRRPVLVASNQSVAEGGTLEFTVAATDPDGDALTYAAYNIPEGAGFASATSTFTWTPGQEQSGNYVVLFTASDSKPGGVDSVNVVVTVGDVNRPPVLDPVGDQLVAEGGSLTIEIAASDPDAADQVTVSVTGLPEGAVVSLGQQGQAHTVISVDPGYREAGGYDVRVTASDNNADNPLSVTRRFKLEVTDTDVAPEFTGQLAGTGELQLTVDEGGSLEIEVAAQDKGGDALSYSASGLPRNAVADFQGSTKMVKFTPDHKQAGLSLFDIIVTDGAFTVSKRVSVTVNDVNLPPVVFQLADQEVEEGDIITFEVDASDPDGDSIEVFIAGRVPFLTEGDPPPARIRDKKVFVFDTALLPADEQIASAVFKFWAVDDRAGVSDTVSVEIAVVRKDSVAANLASGGSQNLAPPGLGIAGQFRNNTSDPLAWLFMFLERSGFLQHAGLPTLASADGPGAQKVRNGVYPCLAGDLTSQFYGIRRGWGLDLSAQTPVEGAEVEITLSYFDEDLPTEVPNFTEERLSVFGFDANQGVWVMMTDVTVDADSNKATFKVTNYSITDYTIGAILDVIAPIISDFKVVAGNYTVVSTVLDTLYFLEGPYDFRVNITDDEIVSSTNAKLYYSIDGADFVEAALERASGNLFTAQLAGPLADGTSIKYYVLAQDDMNVVTSPQGAPDNVYELVVLEYTGTPGDVDMSQKVDIFDLLDLLKVLSGGKEPSLSSDVDANGKTDIFDLLALLRILAG